ncbi:hypothetical protein ACFONI_06450 [Aeromonas media]
MPVSTTTSARIHLSSCALSAAMDCAFDARPAQARHISHSIMR